MHTHRRQTQKHATHLRTRVRTHTLTQSDRQCVNVVVVVKSKFSHRNYFADNKRLVGKVANKGGNP